MTTANVRNMTRALLLIAVVVPGLLAKTRQGAEVPMVRELRHLVEEVGEPVATDPPETKGGMIRVRPVNGPEELLLELLFVAAAEDKKSPVLAETLDRFTKNLRRRRPTEIRL